MKYSTAKFLRWLYLAFFFLVFVAFAVFCFIIIWVDRSLFDFQGIFLSFFTTLLLVIAGVIQFQNGRGLPADTAGRIPCGVPVSVVFKEGGPETGGSLGQIGQIIILVRNVKNNEFLLFYLPKKKFSTLDFPELFCFEKTDKNFVVHEIKS